jgi:hypothetical protein
MRTLIKSVALTLALSGLPLVALTAAPTAALAARPKVDRKKVVDHLREHQQYPATKAQLVAACSDLADFTAAEKKWFADALPEGTYKSADEVVKVLFASK